MKEEFITLYNAEADTVFRYCHIRISDRDQAVDMVQEVFLKFWIYFSSGKIVENKRALVFRIAHNLIIDWYRKKKPISLEMITENINVGIDALAVEENTIVDDIATKCDAQYIINKMIELGPIYQQAVYLRYVEDFKPSEIAEILGISVNVASVRINRGVERLRGIIGSIGNINRKIKQKNEK